MNNLPSNTMPQLSAWDSFKKKKKGVYVCVKLCSFTFLYVVEVMAKALFKRISQRLSRALIKVYQHQLGFIVLFCFPFGCRFLCEAISHMSGQKELLEWRTERRRRGEFIFPYGRSRCDFILYSASALLAVPWRPKMAMQRYERVVVWSWRGCTEGKPP